VAISVKIGAGDPLWAIASAGVKADWDLPDESLEI